MITATCTNPECRWHNTPRNVLGSPTRVECGACDKDTALSDPQPDPPLPEET